MGYIYYQGSPTSVILSSRSRNGLFTWKLLDPQNFSASHLWQSCKYEESNFIHRWMHLTIVDWRYTLFLCFLINMQATQVQHPTTAVSSRWAEILERYVKWGNWTCFKAWPAMYKFSWWYNCTWAGLCVVSHFLCNSMVQPQPMQPCIPESKRSPSKSNTPLPS